MTTGSEISKAGFKYIGTSYSVMDCQAFVERCLADCGIRKDLAGSNAWYRFIMQNGWIGSPELCRSTFGSIPIGAFLFILKNDGKEPGKYQGDGIGNSSHIGIYTGTGKGAINSSSTNGCVCESNFKGKSINGSWNRIGLWREISYGDPVDRILRGGGDKIVPYKAKVIGGGLNLREQPSKNSDRLDQVPEGTVLDVTDEMQEWAKTNYKGLDGWVMKEFLQKEEDSISVPRLELEKIYNAVGDWLGLRG